MNALNYCKLGLTNADNGMSLLCLAAMAAGFTGLQPPFTRVFTHGKIFLSMASFATLMAKVVMLTSSITSLSRKKTSFCRLVPGWCCPEWIGNGREFPSASLMCEHKIIGKRFCCAYLPFTYLFFSFASDNYPVLVFSNQDPQIFKLFSSE